MIGPPDGPLGGLPNGTPLTRPFWEAAARGRLVVQQCRDCGQVQWTPQFACRACLSESVGWLECSGRGVVYSATVVHRSPDPVRWPPPYVVAIVAVEEGPRMLTRVVGCPPADVVPGLPVRVAFADPAGGAPWYEFVPADPAGPGGGDGRP